MDPAQELKGRQIIAAGLMAGVGMFLTFATFFHFSQPPRDLVVLAYLAVGWAVVSPMLAGLIRGRVLARPAAPGFLRERAGMITFFGMLEGPAFFCGVALIVAAPWWPLAAAAVPLATMALNFPRNPASPDPGNDGVMS